MSFNVRVLLPILPALLVVLGAALLQGLGFTLAPWHLLAGAALALVLGWLAAEHWLRQPILKLTERLYRLQQGVQPCADVKEHQGTLGVLENAISDVGQRLQQTETELQRERTQRGQLHERLGERDERYALALHCINDGLWEWDLKTDTVFYSPAWKNLLGYQDTEIGDRLSEWQDRVHPDDRAALREVFDHQMEGDARVFDCVQRLQHRDGHYRWFQVRGRAIRSASGRPYKMIGISSDISVRKRAEAILVGIAEGLSVAAGDQFFRHIVRNFAEVLDVRFAFITECMDQPPTRVRMLAAWMDGQYSRNLEYDLAGTPCDITINQRRINVIRTGLEDLYPIEVGFQSYLGIPIINSAGKVLGHLACLNSLPMEEGIPLQPIFTIFAVRAALEMEILMGGRFPVGLEPATRLESTPG